MASLQTGILSQGAKNAEKTKMFTNSDGLNITHIRMKVMANRFF